MSEDPEKKPKVCPFMSMPQAMQIQMEESEEPQIQQVLVRTLCLKEECALWIGDRCSLRKRN